MKAIDILLKHNLKRTSCREGIIDVVLASNQALSENEIRERLHGNYDRTTFYRSFKTLEECKIIHKIVVDSQIIKYALNNSLTQKKAHAHFYCNDCHVLTCMEMLPIPNYHLPEGYHDDDIDVIIKGVCASCSHEKSTART